MKAVGVVALVAAIMALQLMAAAPTAMARSPQALEELTPAMRSPKVAVERLILNNLKQCAGETCLFGFCILRGCSCQYPYCVR